MKTTLYLNSLHQESQQGIRVLAGTWTVLS